MLFVCLGNICRSPTAEGVFRKLVEQKGCGGLIEIDSAGTHAYHVGEPPDERAQETAARRGIDISHLRGRRATAQDISDFDYILAMDRDNLRTLHAIGTKEMRHKISLFLEYAPNLEEKDVPDPYFGGPGGFDRVMDMIEEAAHGLLDAIRRHHNI